MRVRHVAMSLRQKHLLRGTPCALNAGWPQTPQPLADGTRAPGPQVSFQSAATPYSRGWPRAAQPIAHFPAPASCADLGAPRAPHTLAGLSTARRGSWVGCKHLQPTPWLQPTMADREANRSMLGCAHSHI